VFRGGSPFAHSETFNILTTGGARKRPFCFYTYWVITLCQAPHAESDRDSNMLQLTLAEALRTKRLREFIAQEEARGVEPVALKEF
jgi:hypothetical protein